MSVEHRPRPGILLWPSIINKFQQKVYVQVPSHDKLLSNSQGKEKKNMAARKLPSEKTIFFSSVCCTYVLRTF